MYTLYFLNMMSVRYSHKRRQRRGFRKKQFIILTCPKDIRCVMPCRVTWENTRWAEGRRQEWREDLDYQRKHPVKGVCKDKGELLQEINPYYVKKRNCVDWWCRRIPQPRITLILGAQLLTFSDPMLNLASRLPWNLKCFIITCDIVSFFFSWFSSVSLKIDVPIFNCRTTAHAFALSSPFAYTYENIPLTNRSEISVGITFTMSSQEHLDISGFHL